MNDTRVNGAAGSSMRSGSIAEVFIAFGKLGLISFGGPIAHLSYFRRELVERRRWLDEAQFAQLIALCHSLPGPGSSQLGFALGLIRAGWLGGLAAFIAFTTPSVVLLLAFAQVLPLLDHPLGQSAIHGLKLLAVAVVAQGLLSMVQRLAFDLPRRLIALAAAVVVLTSSASILQLLVIAGGACLGVAFCRDSAGISQAMSHSLYTRRIGGACLVIFGALFAMAIVYVDSPRSLASVAAAFYRVGSLVFGGGHVVLPLLQEAVVEPGWIGKDVFLAGYGAAQAVPGPMFSVAAFLGARLEGPQGGAISAVVSLVAIMLPGLLLVAGVLPWWNAIARHPKAARALAGVNATVVGLLAAALYHPVWTSAVLTPLDVAVALVGFVLISATRTPLLLVLVWCVAAVTLETLLPLALR